MATPTPSENEATTPTATTTANSALSNEVGTSTPATEQESTRPPLKPIATEQDILHAKPLEQLKLGGGLYLWINKKGNKRTFKFRSHFNSRDKWTTVGQYPAMSIDAARKIVDTKYRADLDNARRDRSDSEWNLHLEKGKRRVKSDTEKYPSFNNMEDVGEFIRNLFAYSGSTEIRIAIWLQMLMPSRTTELLTARRADFNTSIAQWMVHSRDIENSDKKPLIHPQIEYLSWHAVQALQELFDHTRNSDYLFPSLCNPETTSAGRNKVIAQAIEEIWMKYPIKPVTFKNLFITTASSSSYFRPEFIKAMLTHKDGKNSIYCNDSYIPQRKALSEWWGNELNRLRFPLAIKSTHSKPPRATLSDLGYKTRL